VFKSGYFGSIGPVVFFYFLVFVPIFGIVYSRALLDKCNKILAVTVGILGGTIMGVLVLNYFMLVTHLMGIKDYEAM